ncbi:dihydroorotate dehydrogenase electron transfer subunit [bacterium]|nr:dihydroorotate dehydrogenase electron transfer subunit [bacterium]
MKIFNVKKEIIENKKVSSNCYRMTFESKEIACRVKPGQFLHIKCSDTYDPLLRRPISVHSIENNVIGILYKVIGRGTGLLSKKTSGDTIDVIGPLGNGFDYQLVSNCQLPILVGGGIGIAPLYFLAQRLVERGSNITVLIGADTKYNILCVDELKKLDCKVKVSTDDGSAGISGTVVDLLKNELIPANSKFKIQNAKFKIFTCGPVPMLKQVNQLASKYNVSSQVSLERQMACGVGACMGCSIKIRNPKSEIRKNKMFDYKQVCKDGPVFDIKEIAWEEM